MDFAKNIGETQSHEDNTIVTIINQNHYNQQNDYIEIIYLFIVTLHYTTLKILRCVDTRVIQSLPQCMHDVHHVVIIIDTSETIS